MKRVSAPRKRLTTAGLTGAIWATLIGSAGLLFAGAAIAGPFGFDLKSSVEPSRAYRLCSKGDGSWNYECITAPKPHPEMDFYLVRFVKDVGVCGVRGVSMDIPDDGSGSNLRGHADYIANQLKHKYGQWSDKVDWLDNDSVFDELPYWMFSLSRGERYYGYRWSSTDLPIEHRSSIDEIVLWTVAENKSAGWFVVEFTTPLEDACEKAMSDVF